MRVDRPPPGEELNTGEATAARQAASTIVLRDAPGGMEVLLVKRNPDARFMGGAWVFPGGSVHEDDGGPAGAGLRELEEEAALSVAGEDALVPYSRWITPSEVKVRFDTWFFVTEAPAGAEAVCDGSECVEVRWLRPQDALDAGERGELLLVFPTIKHLEALAEMSSVAETLAQARGREVVAVQPRVVVGEGGAQVLMPGEPGYDDPPAPA